MSAGRPERRDGDGRNPQGPGRTEAPDGGHERDEQQPKQTGNAAVDEQGGKRSERPEGDTGEDTREPGAEPAGEARDEAAQEPEAETTVIPAQRPPSPPPLSARTTCGACCGARPRRPRHPPVLPARSTPNSTARPRWRRTTSAASCTAPPTGSAPPTPMPPLSTCGARCARRARKRQAVVGMAAAALFVGTAVPALVHVTTSPSSDDRPSIAGHGEDVQGGTGGEGAGSGKEPGAGAGKGDADAPGAERERDKDKGGQSAQPGENPDGSSLPEDARAASSPLCDATQLGSASTSTEGRGADGSLYGTFRVTNVSDRGCTVASSGTVSAVALGAADASKVSVVPHTPGDPATGLPSPVTAASQLVLAPGAAYEVKFAWIPSESCPNTGSGGDGGTGGTTPTDPTPPAEGSSGGTDQGATAPDVQPQLMRSDGGKADGSVTVSHIADPGAPTTATTVPDACAGTVYHTDALPAGG
ncbi:hypothetical protein ACFQVA_18770 [Actinomadura keratinilytica]